MKYKGVEITVRASGKYQLISPNNGTTRIFKTIEKAKYYIDHYEALDSHAEAMARNPW